MRQCQNEAIEYEIRFFFCSLSAMVRNIRLSLSRRYENKLII